MLKRTFIRYSLLALVATIIVIAIFFNQALYSPQTKIEDFKEDYMSGRLDVGSIWRNTHSLGLEGDFIVSWHWKKNSACIEDATDRQAFNQESLDSLTVAMSFGVERIIVYGDTALRVEFRNGRTYSDVQLWLCQNQCWKQSHLQELTYWSVSFPGRFDRPWAYEIAPEMWLVKR